MRRTEDSRPDQGREQGRSSRSGRSPGAGLLIAILVPALVPAMVLMLLQAPATAIDFAREGGGMARIHEESGATNTKDQAADSGEAGLLNLEFELDLDLLVLEIRWSGRLRFPGDASEIGVGFQALEAPGTVWRIARSILEQGS